MPVGERGERRPAQADRDSPGDGELDDERDRDRQPAIGVAHPARTGGELGRESPRIPAAIVMPTTSVPRFIDFRLT
jgi:hypothetical protein